MSADENPTAKRLCILLADDDDNIRVLTERMLRVIGHDVIAAKDGAEAVELFTDNQHTVDFAVLDVVMPHLTGPRVYEHIRALSPSLPVLFTTGFSPVDLQPIIEADDKVGLLCKPYLSADLRNSMEQLW